MSLECMVWAKRQKIEKASAKLVLFCLADHASEKNDYMCWAGRKCIAEEASMSVRAVTTSLNWLEENGFIKREKRFRDDGSQTTNYITLCMNSLSADSAGGGEANVPLSADSAPHEPVTNQLIETTPYIPLCRFDEFWDVYPKKAGKLEARKAWAKAMKQKHDPGMIIEAARAYAFAKHGEEPGFIKNPQGWLNGNRFLDDQAAIAGSKSSASVLDQIDAAVETYRNRQEGSPCNPMLPPLTK